MDRFKGFASFAIIVVLFALVLRLTHLFVPLAYPEVLLGPFSVEEVAEVEQYSGFSPLVPFYRPEQLGDEPIHITAQRRPAKVVFFWQGENFLYLEQALDEELPAASLDACPLEGVPGAISWRRGQTVHVVTRIDETAVILRTDLSTEDARRIVETLRPFERVR